MPGRRTGEADGSAGVKRCLACPNEFAGRTDAVYCSAACKQRAHRSRAGASRNASRNVIRNEPSRVTATGVTATEPASIASLGVGHSAPALQMLADLEAELAESAAKLGIQLAWTAAEKEVLGEILTQVDRRTKLMQAWEAALDVKTQVRVSAELRLVEQTIARGLTQIKTEPPAPRGVRSVKAEKAARVRWNRA